MCAKGVPKDAVRGSRRAHATAPGTAAGSACSGTVFTWIAAVERPLSEGRRLFL